MTTKKTKKRAFQKEEDSSVPSSSKRPKNAGHETEAASEEEFSQETPHDDESEDLSINEINAEGANEYVQTARPTWDFVKEHRDRESSATDEYEGQVQAEEGAVLHEVQVRDWKWTMMRAAWFKLCELNDQAFKRDPDNFDMYLFNDFYSYGLHDLVERLLLDFDKEFRKKSHTLPRMWPLVVALCHWLGQPDTLMGWIQIDDGPRVCATIELIGCAFISTLELLDKMGHMRQGSRFRDLGLVMSLYIEWPSCLPEHGIGNDGELGWREDILAFAERAGIDLAAAGCYGVCHPLKEFDGTKPRTRTSKWKWTRKFNAYVREWGLQQCIPYNLPTYDISDWPKPLKARWTSRIEDCSPLSRGQDLREDAVLPE